MSLTILSFDRETAGHLAVAIALHRRTLDRSGHACPPGLVDLQHFATEIGQGNGQTGVDGGSGGDTGRGGSHTAPDGHGDLLTQRQAAGALGIHPRTLRRWLDRGEVEGVPVAGRRWIPRTELDRLIASRTERKP